MNPNCLRTCEECAERDAELERVRGLLEDYKQVDGEQSAEIDRLREELKEKTHNQIMDAIAGQAEMDECHNEIVALRTERDTLRDERDFAVEQWKAYKARVERLEEALAEAKEILLQVVSAPKSFSPEQVYTPHIYVRQALPAYEAVEKALKEEG